TTVKKSVRMPSLTAEEQEQFSRHFIELYNDAQAKNEDVVQYNNPLLVSHARMMRDYFIALLEKHGRRMEKMMLLVCRKS
ncbi:MAG: hypothetical protein JW795_12165, partial [Chitinivibrionales bacterium]|nr:hypothetical protein [Chitinivibrionales bacterium]